MHKRGLCRPVTSVCLVVGWVSVSFVHCVEVSKETYSQTFSPSGKSTIMVFIARSILTRDVDIGIMSVRLSVCPSVRP